MKQRFNLKSWVPYSHGSKYRLIPHITGKIVTEKSNFDGFKVETWGPHKNCINYRTFTVNHVQNPLRMIAKWTGKRLSKKSR